jgi:regulator of replication initiation timing
MVEKETFRFTTAQDFVRVISSTFDENVITIEAPYTGVSFGTPTEVLESKRRLFKSITGLSRCAIGMESPSWFEQENTQLRIENYALRERIRAVEERLVNIEAAIPRESVVILREISKEEAKKEILELFSQGHTLYYSDVAEQLGLDLQLVVEICNELQSKGEIEVVDDTLQKR